MTRYLPDARSTRALGAQLAAALGSLGVVITLRGELGAGKTTLVRGFLRELGVRGAVRSPTYTLVEPYELARGQVLHLDLYRIADAGEMEFLGLRELAVPDNVLLVEWPEHGAGMLPAADLDVALTYAAPGRVASIAARTPAGAALLAALPAVANE